MSQSPIKPHKNPLALLSRLGGSTAICLIACLSLVDVAARAYMPEDNVDEVYFQKFKNYFTSARKNDVVLLGSSVVASAAYNADLSNDPEMRKNKPDNRIYDKAKYLESQLKQTLNTSCSVENLSCPGCMISDAWTILSKTVAFHKAPKLVIYELFPRDAMDPNMPDLGKTPYWIHVGKMQADGHSDFWSDLSGQVSALSANLAKSGISVPNLTDQIVFKTTLRNTWYYFAIRTNFYKMTSSYAEHLFHRQSSLYAAAVASGTLAKSPAAPPAAQLSAASAQASIKPSLLPAADKTSATSTNVSRAQDNPAKSDIAKGNPATVCAAPAVAGPGSDLPPSTQSWTQVDWTPHKTRFNQELPYLIKMLELCRENNIPMVVVNMPITKGYTKTMLSPQLLAQYKSALANNASQYNALFVDLYDEKAFSDSDFKDLTHTNASGGRKVQENLARALAPHKSALGLDEAQ